MFHFVAEGSEVFVSLQLRKHRHTSTGSKPRDYLHNPPQAKMAAVAAGQGGPPPGSVQIDPPTYMIKLALDGNEQGLNQIWAKIPDQIKGQVVAGIFMKTNRLAQIADVSLPPSRATPESLPPLNLCILLAPPQVINGQQYSGATKRACFFLLTIVASAQQIAVEILKDEKLMHILLFYAHYGTQVEFAAAPHVLMVLEKLMPMAAQIPPLRGVVYGKKEKSGFLCNNLVEYIKKAPRADGRNSLEQATAMRL